MNCPLCGQLLHTERQEQDAKLYLGCPSCRKRIEQKSLKCPRCGGDMMCAVYMRKRIGQETARKIFSEVEKRGGQICHSCKYGNKAEDLCDVFQFGVDCPWWQSLKKGYGVK